MAYGIIKVDTITFTDGGIDKSVSISGLVQNPTFSGNITVTGTISGNLVQGQTVSGVTVTGTTAQFTSGTFTSITGGVATITSGVFASGTAAAPSISVGTTNNGIYSPAANSVALSTNGTGRLFVDATGRVGVNTSAPDSLLHLSSSSPRLTFTDTDTGADHRINADSGAGNLAIDVDFNSDTASPSLVANIKGSERLRITSAGLVGIGTSSPSQKLSIGNGSMFIQNSSGAAVSDLGITFALDANTQGRIYSPSGKSFAIQAGTAGSLTDALTVDQSGRVGIGTTSPEVLLDCRGSGTQTVRVRTTDTSGTAVGILRAEYLGGGGGAYTNVELRAGDAYSYLLNTTSHPLLFGTGATERARIDSSGRLLLGVSTVRNVGAGFQTAQSTGLYIEQPAAGLTPFTTILNRNDTNGPRLFIAKTRGTTVGSVTSVSSGDELGQINFAGADGTGVIEAAAIRAFVDGTPGTNDMPGRLVFFTTADGASSPTERMRINSAGGVQIGEAAEAFLTVRRSANTPVFINRVTDDGNLITFQQDGTAEGTISVSGTTVSYNGAHLSRWSQLPSGQERTEILRGTVLSNIDEMCEWGDEDNEQLNRMKVSDVEGDKNVSGVFQAWDDDDDTYTNDFYCAMTGDFIIRIGAGVTVERGDLLMSAGDGTAKPQDDDIIRSKTIAKVTSTNVSCTYEDGSYCVPCVLMAC